MLPQAAIFLTVMLDLLAFGMVIPDIQLRGEKLVTSLLGEQGAAGQMGGILIGLGISSYSIIQFIFGPIMGRWSDFIGRRPVLIVTTILAVLSSLVYGFATEYWVLLLARSLQGLAGANLGVAYAYVSDSSEPDQRAKAMGQLGAAFGIGFLLGPPVGALLVKAGGGGPFVLGLASAGMSLINLWFVWFFLPESLRKENVATLKENRFAMMARAFRTPALGVLLALFFVANYAFANLESTFFLLAETRYLLDQFQAALVLVIVGGTSAFVQGFIVPRITPALGEVKILRMSYALQAPSLAILPWTMPWLPLILGTIFLSFASGIGQPSISSLISKATPPNMSGGIFGVTQSLGAIARIVGPLTAIPMLKFKFWLPYTFAAVLLLVPLIGMLLFKELEPEAAPEAVF